MGVYGMDESLVAHVRDSLSFGLIVNAFGADGPVSNRLVLAAVDRGIELGFWDENEPSTEITVDVRIPARSGEIPHVGGEP